MKLSSWMALVGAALVMSAACTTRRVSADDDDGTFAGGGGSGGDPSVQASTTSSSAQATVSSTTTVSSTVAASSSSSGTPGCDSNVPGDLGDSICESCVQCTQSGPCASQWSACGSGSPCDVYWNCAIDCDTQCSGDPTCFEACLGTSPDPNDPCSSQTPAGTCIGDHPTGCTAYILALSCSICVECPTNCNAAGNCS